MPAWRAARIAAVVAAYTGARASGPVTWTGAGDGTSWGQGANWSTGAAPTSADDVVIDVSGEATVVIGTGVGAACASLSSAEIVRVESTGSLTVDTAAR